MPTERVTEHVSRRLALHAWSATAVVAVGGLLFVLIAPGVGDMWAALARAQAARDGVTLGYWFSWYSGAHPPGGYSVIVPWLSALLGAHLVVGTFLARDEEERETFLEMWGSLDHPDAA